VQALRSRRFLDMDGDGDGSITPEVLRAFLD
jgi:hypothetical protein